MIKINRKFSNKKKIDIIVVELRSTGLLKIRYIVTNYNNLTYLSSFFLTFVEFTVFRK